MYIHISIDEQHIVQSAQANMPLIFEIAWEHEGRFYPAHHWSDFGGVILVWWLQAAFILLDGTSDEDFLFMDGPFALQASYNRSTRLVRIVPRNTDWAWLIPPSEVIRVILDAADLVATTLTKLDIYEEERASLLFGIDRIKAIANDL